MVPSVIALNTHWQQLRSVSCFKKELEGYAKHFYDKTLLTQLNLPTLYLYENRKCDFF